MTFYSLSIWEFLSRVWKKILQKSAYFRLKSIGMLLALYYMVFHRILDFKTGCISMLALFFALSKKKPL